MRVIWTGPVSLAQVAGATELPGTSGPALNVQCKGDGDPTCGQIADSWSVPKLDHVPGMPAGDTAFLGAFSAGGSFVKRVFMDPADRARIEGALLSDAMYTGWLSPGQPDTPEGFVRYALDALTGQKLFVATVSSSPNKDLPTGSQVLEAVVRETERRSGKAFEFYDGGSFDGLSVQPVRSWILGGAMFLDFGARVSHGDHANKLAKEIWPAFVRPWFEGTVATLPPSSTEPAVPLWAWFAAGAAGGIVVTQVARRILA